MVLVVKGSFHFNSNAIKAIRRLVRATLRSFNASSRMSFNVIASLSVSRFTRPPLRVLMTLLCRKYFLSIKICYNTTRRTESSQALWLWSYGDSFILQAKLAKIRRDKAAQPQEVLRLLFYNQGNKKPSVLEGICFLICFLFYQVRTYG